MITKNLLEDLVKYYDREGAWDKLEALYIAAIGLEGFYNARTNIKIRYGSDESVKEVERDIERLCGERGIYSQTDDGGEEVRKILVTACEQIFPEILTRNVIESVPFLSKTTKRFLFLFYKEGGILDGEISLSDQSILAHFTPAYKIIFGELEGDEYEVRQDVCQEMVKTGLIYKCWGRSNKHHYYSLIVSPFAKNVWLNLPDILTLPNLHVNELW